MKNITLFALFLVMSFSPLLVKADVIPPNSHSLDRCAKVVNLDMFPEISLIGVVNGPMSNSNPNIILKNNECISKGYKFNTIDIYWIIKGQNFTIDNGILLIKNMDVYGGYINDSNPLVKETVEYSISKPDTRVFSLQKTKVISEYNDGTPTGISVVIDDPYPIIDVSMKSKITKKLKIGIKNDNEVKYLQKVLNKVMMSSLVEDGSFGLKTKIAVIKFQKANNLIADGIVGLKTMAIVNGL